MANKRMQPTWDPLVLAAQLRNIAEQSQRLMRRFVSHQPEAIRSGGTSTLGFDFFELMTRMMTDPVAVARAQIDLFYNSLDLWQKTAERMLMLRAHGADAPKDRRFKHPEWSENAIFSFVKESYLVAAKSILSAVREVKGMDDATARKVDFYTRQFVDALSPSNFVATNPEVLTATLQSGGQNLLRGLENLLVDLERGHGNLRQPLVAFDYDDRPEGFPPQRKHRNDSRKNRLPERAHAIDSIQAIDARSPKAATAHRAAVDQQVLCSRSTAEEFLH